MRVWQKIYLATLFISILFVNLGIYGVFHLTYAESLKSEQNRGETSYRLIAKSVQNTMSVLEKDGRLSDAAVKDLMRLYEHEYENQNIEITIWKNGEELYSGRKNQELISVDSEEIKTVICGERWEKSFVATSQLSGLKEKYQLSVRYPLTELNEIWRRLFKIYIFVNLGVIAVLAILLNILVRRLLRPLERLEMQAHDMEHGDYESRVLVKGRDEIAALGNSLNSMAETIQEQIATLQSDNEKKEQLVGDLAHEMKSPLTSIYGYAEYLLKANPSPEEAVDYYHVIMEESERMQSMSYALMDLAELRKKDISFAYFSADDFLKRKQETIKKRQLLSDKKNAINIVWKCLLKPDEQIYGNEELLSILLLNLVTNAIRAVNEKNFFTNATGAIQKSSNPEIYVLLDEDVHQDEESEASWRLIVQDNGIGIPKDKLEHITEPFYRVDKGRSREQGGNGLGLALCQRIVELHKGNMEIISEEGVGTTVIAKFMTSD